MKFGILNKIEKLTKKEKEVANELKKIFDEKSEEKIIDGLKKIPEKMGMSVKEFFETSYKILIGKTKGPKLSTLIVNGREEINNLLNQI